MVLKAGTVAMRWTLLIRWFGQKRPHIAAEPLNNHTVMRNPSRVADHIFTPRANLTPGVWVCIMCDTFMPAAFRSWWTHTDLWKATGELSSINTTHPAPRYSQNSCCKNPCVPHSACHRVAKTQMTISFLICIFSFGCIYHIHGGMAVCAKPG